MKKTIQISLVLLSFLAIGLSGCKKCSNCNYTNVYGNKGPTFEVCGQELEDLKAQPDADRYECLDS